MSSEGLSTRWMSTIKRNLVASFLGRGWAAILQVLLVPVFLHLLGPAAYALVGFYALLYSVVARLDLGLSTTLNRELARSGAILTSSSETEPDRSDSTSTTMRDLLRTLEVVYFAVAGVLGVLVATTGPWIAHHWLRAGPLSAQSIASAIMLMGAVVAAQWPISLYEGGLRGLERQTVLNGIGAAMATTRGVGAVLVLLWVSRSVTAYFVWQAVVNAVHVCLLATATWRSMPKANTPPKFRRAELVRIARFTAAISGISILSLALTQSDKIVLSRMLPLDQFGYYTVAASVGAGLLIVSLPLFEAVFPRLAALVASGAEETLRETYHAAIQLSTVLAIPAAAVLFGFSTEVAGLWLHDAVAVSQTHLLMALLAVGTAINVVMTIPFAMQLAAGWTRLSLYKNAIALALAVPMLLLSVRSFGAVGAAFTWIAINTGYLIFELPFMHHRLLRGALQRVYFADIGSPTLAAVAAVFAARIVAVRFDFPPLLAVTVASTAAIGCAALSSPLARRYVAQWRFRRASSAPIG